MFHIDCFCDDKKLVAALKGLSGLVLKLEVKPVAGAAKEKNGHLKGATAEETAANFIQSQPKFSGKDLQQMLVKAGYARNSTYSILSRLVKAKAVRRVEKGQYEVI